MFKKFLLVLGLLAFVTPAFAQTTASRNVPGHYNTPHTGLPGCGVTTVGPCYIPSIPAIPLGFQQLASLGTATALTPPGGAIEAFIVCTGQTVLWRDDGTNPTASVGVPLPVNTAFPYTGNLAAIKFIQATASATCNVSYYG